MKTRTISLGITAALLAGAISAIPAQARPAPDKTDNVTRIANLELGWVSEIAFDGRWAYVYGQSLWIVDRFTKKVVGTLSCPGKNHYPGEVEVVEPGLIVIDKTEKCAASDSLVFVDVRNPRRPRVRSVLEIEGNHTLTAYPGKPVIYVSPNGLAGDGEGGIERIVDASNPDAPKVLEHTSTGLGCHDVGFVIREDVQLAGCAGGSETQIWDVSDPLAPVTIARIPTPYVFFNHSAGFSDDAKLLVVGDEAHGANSCAGTPTGALWFYDVTDPTTPILKGTHGNSHGSAASSFWGTFETWCTGHMYDFEAGTHVLASGWYQGGLTVLDLADPSAPKEIAHYVSDDFFPWAAYWVDEEIWTSDTRGWCNVSSAVACSTTEGGGVEIFTLDR